MRCSLTAALLTAALAGGSLLWDSMRSSETDRIEPSVAEAAVVDSPPFLSTTTTVPTVDDDDAGDVVAGDDGAGDDDGDGDDGDGGDDAGTRSGFVGLRST